MALSTILYIHGSESNSQTYKAQLLRKYFPNIIVPDFSGSLSHRMIQLESYVKDKNGWILIGSSLGGAMAVIYSAQHPDRVKKLILLAPALHLPEIMQINIDPIFIPTVLIIGTEDLVIPIKSVLHTAKRIFPRLTFLSVEDDHRLHHIADQLDWKSLLA